MKLVLGVVVGALMLVGCTFTVTPGPPPTICIVGRHVARCWTGPTECHVPDDRPNGKCL